MSEDVAKRLKNILSGALKHGEQNQIKDVWASVLEVDSNNEIELMRRLVSVVNLFDEVEFFIESSEVDKEIYLDGINRAREAVLTSNLHASWKGKRSSLEKSAFITRLDFCSKIISELESEDPISGEELSDISRQVDELFNRVDESDLNLELKNFVMRSLESARRAISEYKITGSKGIRQALHGFIGEAIDKKHLMQDCDEEGVLSEVTQVFAKLDRISAGSMRYFNLLEKTSEMLPYFGTIG